MAGDGEGEEGEGQLCEVGRVGKGVASGVLVEGVEEGEEGGVEGEEGGVHGRGLLLEEVEEGGAGGVSSQLLREDIL